MFAREGRNRNRNYSAPFAMLAPSLKYSPLFTSSSINKEQHKIQVNILNCPKHPVKKMPACKDNVPKKATCRVYECNIKKGNGISTHHM